MSETTPLYLKSLNEKQREAVEITEGPLLILAGAGAGKTKTITHRILHIIKNGTAPEEVLAITFTNKAAKEMRERVIKLLEEDRDLNLPVSNSSRPFVSTFHALSVHILKEFGSHIGVARHFAIYDKADSRSAIKEAITMAGQDPKRVEPGKVLGAISREKGNFVSQEEYEALHGDDYMGAIIAEAWKHYEQILKKDKALDFDDLLFKATYILVNFPEVRQYYQKRWKYIHIDEYQDTNKVQYTLSRMLVGQSQNLAVVGDIDQNIYSWRGADIKNILRFEEDYPNAHVILLEENYRSTQIILSAANEIIAKNIHRREKNLFTRNAEGEKISVYQGYDEADEANFIGNTARDLIADGVKADEIAVLYRANFQSRALEEAFLKRNIPYQLLGTRFYERKEVKDLLSYARAALNPDSLADIKRIINTPVRGIGKVSLLKVLAGQEGSLPSATRAKVQEFRDILGSIRKKIETEKPSEVIRHILLVSGIEKSLREGKEEDEERLENARELVSIATRYDTLVGPAGLEQLLEDAALASDQDNLEKPQISVKLMTVHAAKGLEFDYVFIAGMEQDLFPHARMNESSISAEESEEERRLFYVALTRARKKLYLTHANVRTIFGNKQVNMPSEFINDISPESLDVEQKEEITGIKSIFIDF
ncbi:MAG: hypothetical protein RL094_139 [Candidatus Parcubacteria bacterium]|jgi:DNA helicase-2/ATP-dependent DNA helicase PcrA